MAPKKLILTLIISLALILRLINLGQSFWLDEASQAQMSVKSLGYIWDGRGGDFHPPLFYLLAHFWLFFGHTETWARLLPVSFGLLTVITVYFLAEQIFPEQKIKLGKVYFSPGMTASFLLAINPYHIYYSQEFRSYSLLCLLGSISIYFLLKRKFFILSLVNSLLLYTHYSALFLIFTQFIYVFFYSKKDVHPWLKSQILSFLLFLPWIPQFLSQLNTGLRFREYLPGWEKVLSLSPFKTLPETLFKFTAGRITFVNRIVYLIYALFVFVCIFLAFIISHLKTRLLHTWLILPLLCMLIASFFAPQNQPFRIIYCLVPLVLIFTESSFRYPKLMLTLFVYISLVGNMLYFTRPNLQREQWRQAISFLSSQRGSILVKFPDKFAPFYWYSPSLPVLPLIPSLPLSSEAVLLKISSIPQADSQVFLVEYLTDLVDPNRQIEQLLKNSGFSPGTVTNFPGVGFIEEYHRI